MSATNLRKLMDLLGLDEDDLPPELSKAMRDSPDDITMHATTIGSNRRPRRSKIEPVGVENPVVQALMRPRPSFVVGEQVTLRPEFSERYKFPKNGDVCTITQVLDAPHRAGDYGSPVPAMLSDIALAFIDPSDGVIFEMLYDSRQFMLAPKTTH